MVDKGYVKLVNSGKTEFLSKISHMPLYATVEMDSDCHQLSFHLNKALF